jgi:hypothetical protein
VRPEVPDDFRWSHASGEEAYFFFAFFLVVFFLAAFFFAMVWIPPFACNCTESQKRRQPVFACRAKISWRRILRSERRRATSLACSRASAE